jgi:hypothetical protein
MLRVRKQLTGTIIDELEERENYFGESIWQRENEYWVLAYSLCRKPRQRIEWLERRQLANRKTRTKTKTTYQRHHQRTR